MKKIFELIVYFILGITAGCATHNPISPPDLDNDLAAQRYKQVKDGVEVMALPVHEKIDLANHFDEDLIYDGVLPVQIDIENKSGESCSIDITRASLHDAEGKSFPPLTLDDVYSEASHTYAYAIPWAIGFGLVGGIPSMINVAVVNDRIKKDYYGCMLKSDEMVPGSGTTGTLFFPVDDKIKSLDDWYLTFGLTRNGEPIDFTFDLHGTVEQPRVPQVDKKKKSRDL